MWYCTSCGKENGENARFCEECGRPRAQQPTGQGPAPAAPVGAAGYSVPAAPKKKSRWWLWLIIVLAVLAAAAVVCYFTVHLWNPATCTEPETCKICGKTQGAPLGHIPGNATCTEPSACLRCGVTLSGALGHDPTEATCTQPSTCRRCGEVLASALGHDWEPATYDRPETCARCGVTRGDVKGYVGDLNGHMSDEDLYLYSNSKSHAYVLDEPVRKCLRMTLYLKLTGVTGDPYGDWAIYGRDLNGSWQRLSTFYVTQTAYNNYVSFEFELDGTQSFDALSILPLTGASYSISYSFYYEDVQVYVD